MNKQNESTKRETDKMNKQKEKLIEHLDQYYASMFEQLKTFENECVKAVECRDFTCYDSMFQLNEQEKEQDLILNNQIKVARVSPANLQAL